MELVVPDSMISGNRGSNRIPHVYQALTTLFLDKTSTKSYDSACLIYISVKNVNLFKENIQDMRVSFVVDRLPMDPDSTRSLRSRVRMDLFCLLAKADL